MACPRSSSRIEKPNGDGCRPLAGFGALIFLISLAACASPTETAVSIDAEMPLGPGEAIVLLPGQRQNAFPSDVDFVRCLRDELTERAVPHSAVMDTAEFQDAMFPWFEVQHSPRTAQEMDDLLSRPRVRERIGHLKVRYLVSMVLSADADGFPGMLCGGGYGGAGCLGLAWEDKTSRLDAVVWDLESGREAGGLSISSSGRSVAFGAIIPIIFIAYTESEVCNALAAALGNFLNGKARINTPGS